MSYEIDFLNVGDPGEDGKVRRSGDAIAVRWGNLSGRPEDQMIMIVDGGFTSSGEALVRHVKHWYGTDKVDLVVSSHPHDDHIQGLFPVLENLRIDTLLMHRPWEHAKAVVDLLNDNRRTYTGSKKQLKESFEAARSLYNLAVQKGINVVEPFQGVGTQKGDFRVLGPSKELYERLLAADLAEKKVSQTDGLLATLSRGLQAAIRAMTETWDKEELAEPGPDAVEPLNHTSTIIHLNLGDATALLTADAGVLALDQAEAFARSMDIDLRQCTRVQIPHHGSKRNVEPKILDRIIGPILPLGTVAAKIAMLSAAKDGEPKHPSARVVNAFLRRGAAVSGTKGQCAYWYSPDLTLRKDWIPLASIPFRGTYDEENDE